MFRVGRATESHVASLDSAVAGKTPGGDAPFFGGMHRPTLGPFLEIRILYVSEKERVPGQHCGFPFDGIVPVQLAHKSHCFLIR